MSFISRENFLLHVSNTITQYGDKLKPYNLKKFNKNTIDPIKLIFDKNVYNYTWEEIIKNEILRQRDKSSNNDIGYFHQRIFQYIDCCSVPQTGWDVIFKQDNIKLKNDDEVSTVFVEMKNKHNTMNSSSSSKTYINMQSQILKDDDCACFLVEIIAKKSQDIDWVITVDGTPNKHRRIRRVSIDKFYELVTGQKDAFFQMCMALPEAIDQVLQSGSTSFTPNDSVITELNNSKYQSITLALFMLGFGSYEGFPSC